MSRKTERLDPRVMRTRQLLRHALIELVPEKGFTAITVQDITDRATLNRATFYLHYRDKHELLLDVFEELIKEAELMPPDASALPARLAPPSIVRVFDHVAEHAEFYRVILGEEAVPSFVSRIREYIAQIAQRWITLLRHGSDDSSVPTAIAVNFISAAYIGVIVWWLQNGMPHSSEYMATQLMRLTVQGMDHALGMPGSVREESTR